MSPPASIKTVCPACEAKLKASASHAGREMKCPTCKHRFVVEVKEATDSSDSGMDATAYFDPTESNGDTNRSTETQGSAKAPSPPLPEQFGKYRVLDLLGRGAMGTVYLAEDPQLERKVAIKVPSIDSDDTDAEEVRDRFRREARAIAALQHSNICQIYEVAENDGQLYLAMAYIKGRPLTEATSPKRLLPVKRALLLVRKIALALEVAHRAGVIHRDLKPDNVLVAEDGEPQVMDFGLARRQDADDTTLTAAGHLVGSPSYMSPEQASGNADRIGPHCDIWSLGVILYELLTGSRPFLGDTVIAVLKSIALDDPPPPSTLRSGLDPRLDAICLKALAKNVDRRFQSMRQFAQALADYITGKRVIRGVPEAPQREGEPSQSGLALLGSDSTIPVVQPPEEEDSGVEYRLAEDDHARCSHCGGPLDEAGGCPACLAESDKDLLTVDEEQLVEVTPEVTPRQPRRQPQRKQSWGEWLGLEDREGEVPFYVYIVGILVVALVGALIALWSLLSG